MSEAGAKKKTLLLQWAKKRRSPYDGQKKDAALADRVLRLNLNPVA